MAAASDRHGVVLVGTTMSGYFIQSNEENFVDNNPRSEARWKDVIKRLRDLGYLDTDNKEVYRITEEGYKRADIEAKKMPLEGFVKIQGPANNQKLDLTVNKPVTLTNLGFLTSSEACIVETPMNVSISSHSEIPIDHKNLVQLFNTPRPDRNSYDHSGPAKLRLSFKVSDQSKEVIVPTMLQPHLIENTQWVGLTGSQRFEV